MRKATVAVALVICFGLLAQPCLAVGGDPLPTYSLNVVVNAGTGTITGRLAVSLVNSSSSSISSVPVYLYANTFSQPDPDLVDANFALRFPSGFSAGAMNISKASVQGVEVAVEPVEGDLVVELHLPAELAVPPGGVLQVEISFVTKVPERFGAFSWIDGGLVLMGGWYPALFALGAGGFEPDRVGAPAKFDCSVSAKSAGLLVLGNRMYRVGAEKTVRSRFDWTGPLLLYFQPDFGISASLKNGQKVLKTVVRQRGEDRVEWLKPVVDSVLPVLGAPENAGEPFLVLEGSLRETMAMPFPGGIVLSDLAFSVAPLVDLIAQHRANVQAAAFAGKLMKSCGISMFDALLALNLYQLLKWDKGEVDPLYFRRVLTKGEFLGALDKFGTDPQVHFKSSMFFMPELPAEMRRSFELLRLQIPSPHTAARIIFKILGAQRTGEALATAIERRTSVVRTALELANAQETAGIAASLSPGEVELKLEEVLRVDGRWRAMICKHGFPSELPLEMLVDSGSKTAVVTADCAGDCCGVDLGAASRAPKVKLDPYGVFQQKWTGSDHPRRNDRSYTDLKWVVSRIHLTLNAGDSIPSASFELVLQPRFDLRHSGFIKPRLDPSKVALLGGWRYGFGKRVRPSFLAWSLSIGLRAIFGIDDDAGNNLGLALTLVHYNRQSTMNPFRGNWSYVYLYPIASFDFQHYGSRFGGLVSQVFGRSPDHVLAMRVRFDSGAGWLPDWDRAATGGVAGMRAFASTDISRRHALVGSLEYRWMMVRNLNFSLARLAYLTGIQLAFFVDAATADDHLLDLFGSGNSYIDTGLGIRGHLNILGTIPTLLGVELAYLLPVLGTPDDGFNVTVGFTQPF